MSTTAPCKRKGLDWRTTTTTTTMRRTCRTCGILCVGRGGGKQGRVVEEWVREGCERIGYGNDRQRVGGGGVGREKRRHGGCRADIPRCGGGKGGWLWGERCGRRGRGGTKETSTTFGGGAGDVLSHRVDGRGQSGQVPSHMHQAPSPSAVVLLLLVPAEGTILSRGMPRQGRKTRGAGGKEGGMRGGRGLRASPFRGMASSSTTPSPDSPSSERSQRRMMIVVFLVVVFFVVGEGRRLARTSAASSSSS